jgi:hypothetical protein
LGHRKLGTTGVYTEHDPEYLKAACEALDGLLQALLAKSLPDNPGTKLEKSGKSTVSCRSSVVEHSLGKGEVVCSIHTGSTSKNSLKYWVFLRSTPNAVCARLRVIVRERAVNTQPCLFGDGSQWRTR